MQWSTRYGERDTQNAWVWGPLVLLMIGGLISLGASALTITASGPDSHNHREGIPVGVAQLSPSAYLISKSANVAPTEVCRGSDTTGGPIRYLSRARALQNSLYVECEMGQTWNDHRSKAPNFGGALISTIVNPGWYIPVGGLFLLILVYPTLLTFGTWRYNRAQKRVRRVDFEQARRELRASWARDEIDDLTFQTKMDALYAQGVKPEDD